MKTYRTKEIFKYIIWGIGNLLLFIGLILSYDFIMIVGDTIVILCLLRYDLEEIYYKIKNKFTGKI